MSKPKIGFIGTGVMGKGMASNLLKGRYELSVYNRTQQKALPLIENGALWKPSIALLTAWADIVITIVSYPKDVEEVYFSPDGILNNARPGSFVVDMTTSSPKLAIKIYEAAKEKGVFALDAPVSGGDVGARNGTLCIMAGGDEDAFEALMPVFSILGKSAILQGSAGAGQQTKMCNQICIAANIMGVCESLAYAKSAGLDEAKVLETLGAGGAASWQLSAYAPRILKGDYEPGFYIKHFVKDMRIALEESESMELQMPALKLSKSLYDRLMSEDMGELGTQALYKLYTK
ncbi:MAG: NAD(P)-dependent oxidoreductase [Clostridia bacterium]|nr:NAD(P)-dependent oxidoreductase [Clostridia bacterium]